MLGQAGAGAAGRARAGVVHRDVKPGNILIRADGEVKITDFGIAKAANAVPVTRTGMVMGTAQYIAPEQARARRPAPACDVYSLGVVGYECLAGHRPFLADGAVAVAMMQVRETAAAAARRRARAGPGADRLDLAKDPAGRYGTAASSPTRSRRVRTAAALPIPGIPVQGAVRRGRRWRSTRPARRSTRPSRRPGRPSAPIPVPAPSMSPISSPGMSPARPADIAPDTDDADAPLASGPVASATPSGQPHSHRARNDGLAPVRVRRRPAAVPVHDAPHRAVAHPTRPRTGPRPAPGCCSCCSRWPRWPSACSSSGEPR